MYRLTLIAFLVVGAAFTTPAAADDAEDYIEELQRYLDVSEAFLNLANRKEAVVFFAVEGIVEIHEERGEQAKAIPALQSFLEKYPDNLAVRNIIRFKLRDLYRETGQTDLALTEMQTIIEENSPLPVVTPR